MKFANVFELEKFIRNQNLFTGFVGLQEIYEGGSSYNFKIIVRTKGKNSFFLLKLLNNYNTFIRLKNILLLVDPNSVVALPKEKFHQYYLVAFVFIEGHKLHYGDCSKTLLSSLISNYQKITNITFPKNLIKPQIEAFKQADGISKYIYRNKHWSWRLINRFFWRKFAKQLYTPATSEYCVIHGDLAVNNILIDNMKNSHLLDFGNLRYGYISEDIAELVCQLSGFRGLYGNMNHFYYLYNLLNNLMPELNKKSWLYGIQIFYLMVLSRHINNKDKRLNVRKNICLLFKLLNYYRLQRFIEKQF